MKITTSKLFALVLLCICGAAQAGPNIFVNLLHGEQVGSTSYARVELYVHGWSSFTSLTIGGGYTLDCNTGVQVNAERSIFSSWATTNDAWVFVPSSTPEDYNIGNIGALPAGSCRNCSLWYRGRVLEGSGSITGGTHGWSFTFNVGGVEITQADTRIFSMCKGDAGGGGGCTDRN